MNKYATFAVSVTAYTFVLIAVHDGGYATEVIPSGPTDPTPEAVVDAELLAEVLL